MYYKVKLNNEIVDALEDLQCVCFITGVSSPLLCTKTDIPVGIISSNGEHIWHVEGWPDMAGYDTVTISEISAEEYRAIREAIDSGGVDIPDYEPDPDPEDSEVLEFVRAQKLKEISACCNETISSGFYVTLSDGESYHFTLDTTDQIAIEQLARDARSGVTYLPWHADDELFRLFTPEDVLLMDRKRRELILYNQAYHNSLKTYVESLRTISEIAVVEYGMRLPEECTSEVLAAFHDDGTVEEELAAYLDGPTGSSDSYGEDLDDIAESMMEVIKG